MTPTLTGAIEGLLNKRIRAAVQVSGGDINDGYRVTLEDGTLVFVKSNERAPDNLFQMEARGLDWLTEVNALRVPRVIGVSQGAPHFLVLEFIDAGSQAPNFDEVLGLGLARLHRAGAPEFGWVSDNFIGTLAQANDPLDTWAQFYRERRLEPLLKRALDSGRAPPTWLARFERLFASFSKLVVEEPPARLHGDLWIGNVHVGPSGEPCLIDPAVYGGQREVDLAMLRLFGGVSERAFEVYERAFPLLPGASERVSLYQLYPLLVHVNLFGGSYVRSVEQALSKLP
jgi:fructosamine-3-kinase